MKKFLLAVGLLVLLSCSPDPANFPTPTPPVVVSASLEWEPNTESDLAGYHIYRGLITGLPLRDYSTYQKIGTVTETRFVDATGIPGTTYYYVVTAFDTADPSNESEASNEVSKTF